MPDQVSKHYLGQEGEGYFKYQQQSGTLGGELNRDKFQHFINLGDIVLDVGCGGGYLLNALSCSRRIGVEVNPVAANVARRSGIECYEALDQVPDEIADVVISHHALEHMLSPLEALKEIRCKLRQGASFMLVVPLDDWRTQRTFRETDVNHHLFGWTPQNLGNLLSEAGFSVYTGDITIHKCAWPPGYETLSKIMPGWAFRWICWMFSILVRRRELRVVVLRSRA
jgi:SAM-dependent methyltransferase